MTARKKHLQQVAEGPVEDWWWDETRTSGPLMGASFLWRVLVDKRGRTYTVCMEP